MRLGNLLKREANPTVMRSKSKRKSLVNRDKQAKEGNVTQRCFVKLMDMRSLATLLACNRLETACCAGRCAAGLAGMQPRWQPGSALCVRFRTRFADETTCNIFSIP
jgi:hypothetical protein